MNIKEYLEELYKLKSLAVDRFGELTQVEKQVFDASFEWLVDNLEIKRGEVVADEELSKTMDEFLQAVVDIIANNPGYQSKLNQFLTDLSTIQKNNKLFHRTTNNFDINVAGVNDVQKAVVEEVMNQYTGNGLNANFVKPLRDNVFRNMLAGANMKEVKEVLRNYILGGGDESGKLSQYLDQTAMQAVDTYTGAINQKIAETFATTGFIISGSLIETSSKQCIYAVETSDEGYLSNEDWEKVLQIARNNPKARLIPGTTLKNLPLNKLHWGCRHDFTPVIMKAAKKKEQTLEEKLAVAHKAGIDSIDFNTDKNGDWTPERKKLHREIIDSFISKGKRKSGKVYILGGATANGKSSLLETGTLKHPRGIVRMNPDEVKEMLPEYRILKAQKIQGAATFTHEESSFLTKEIIKEAVAQKKDFLVDAIGGGDFDKYNAKIATYKQAGNYVKADYVTLDTDMSLKLAELRYQKTGRFVPPKIIVEKNIEISKLVPRFIEENTFDELNLWDTNIKNSPRLILTKKDGNLTVFDQELYKQFLLKAKYKKK